MLTRRGCHVFGLLIGVGLTPLAVMLFDRRDPVTLNFEQDEHCHDHCKGEIIPYYVRPMQKVEISWPVQEHRSCQGAYTRRILEKSTGKMHVFDSLPVAYSDTISSDRKRFSKEFVIPKAISAGPAVYFTVGHRWCNVMQHMFWPMAFRSPDIPFEVLPDDQSSRGLQGTQGPPGIQGYQGVQGIQGERGQRGTPAD